MTITIPDALVPLIADAFAVDSGTTPPLEADAAAFVDQIVRGHIGRVVDAYESSQAVRSAVILAQAAHADAVKPAAIDPALMEAARALGGAEQAWSVGEVFTVEDIGALRAFRGVVYELIGAHTTQSDWTPDAVPALWRVHRAATTGTPDPWVQPESTNPYQIGDRVLWTDGKVYESVVKDNVWSVSAYPQGWKLIP